MEQDEKELEAIMFFKNMNGLDLLWLFYNLLF